MTVNIFIIANHSIRLHGSLLIVCDFVREVFTEILVVSIPSNSGVYLAMRDAYANVRWGEGR